MRYNSSQVSKTLKLVIKALDKHKIKHLFFGSIIPAAINGSLHRPLGDLDLFVDVNKKDLFMNELKKLGYFGGDRKLFKIMEAFNGFDYRHSKLLEISFFAVEFGKEKTSLKAVDFPFIVKIENEAIKPTKYKLLNIPFSGIPQDTAYTGALIAKWNPKRKKEFEIFKEYGICPRANNYLWVYWSKLEISWSYDLLNSCLNLLGRIRMWFGLTYDLWR